MDCTCCNEIEVVTARFGIRAYSYDQPSLGATFHIVTDKAKRYACINLDIWKISYTFGWSLIPAEGDGGKQLI